MTRLGRRSALAGLVAMLGLATPAWAAETAAPMKVVASFSILGDFVKMVGGDKVDLAILVPPEADAHEWTPGPDEVKTLAGARLFIVHGLGFEEWLKDIRRKAKFKGTVATATRGIKPMMMAAGQVHSHGGGPAHAHGGGAKREPDPHLWNDPQRMQTYTANIVEALAKADPKNAATYRANGAAVKAKLAALEAWAKGEIAMVPADKRRAITTHDDFGYMAARYGFKLIEAQGAGNDAEVKAADVPTILAQTRNEKTKALFLKTLKDPAVAKMLEDGGAVVGPPMYADTLSQPTGPAPNYEAMQRYAVTQFKTAMLKN
ncbi:MAG: zinc ABC transporter substrate-binding protein [Alphaproteobacteria bacterium]|nr:zinc ABC transporter substrate-binding protein [Alphaproteobacteria bacterium]